MRRLVAICNFNLADYSRQESQEGVGLQGGNATDVRADKHPLAVRLVLWWIILHKCSLADCV